MRLASRAGERKSESTLNVLDGGEVPALDSICCFTFNAKSAAVAPERNENKRIRAVEGHRR